MFPATTCPILSQLFKMAPNTDIATRALVVTLKSPHGGAKSTAEISRNTNLSPQLINQIYARAIKRGFEPNSLPLVIRDEWLQDAPRSGRPTKITPEVTQKLVAKVRLDRFGREMTCADLAGFLSTGGIDISASTIHKILKKIGFRKTKPTRKPGLTKKMKKERLEWCRAHENWTLEDWKKVIWTDETAVVLGYRRGGYRVWRTKDEAFTKSCIRERWKGYSEFMFWGSFTYDRKGPYHCWLPEKKDEKKKAEKEIAKLNEELEPMMKENWELQNGMRRLELRNLPGPKPKWRWTTKNGKLTRKGTGGIDWWRYQQTILLPKLLPFAKECSKDRSGTLVMEDLAPAHAHHYQQHVYDLHKVQKLLWCPNSPDLNPIEPCWFWMKRETTKKGAPKSRAEAIRAWERCWRSLTQEKIQAWIKRVMIHIKEIIRLDGGNEYKEGRCRS